jgi:hypothetical protein
VRFRPYLSENLFISLSGMQDYLTSIVIFEPRSHSGLCYPRISNCLIGWEGDNLDPDKEHLELEALDAEILGDLFMSGP